LLRASVSRVVIATRDPHPLAAGAGVERLRAAGIAVEFGLMEAEARAQNAAFFARWDKA
jgi:diaminohydroxyphosphoribosylaminopyrimidine deaminase/5-amino-6-(5-phosphoribosylamino)uracil reductase